MTRPCLLPFTSRPLTPEESKAAAKWMPLLYREAAKRAKSRTERDELIAAFVPALLRCVMRFDVSRGTGYQALLTRAFANAYVDHLRKLKTGSRHQRAPEWVFDRAALHEPAPQWRLDPEPAPEEAPRAPSPMDRARQAVQTALALGHTYRQAAEAARKHLGRPVSLDTVARIGRHLGADRRRGRPSCDTPALRALACQPGKIAPRARELNCSRMTLRKWQKMFGASVRRDGNSQRVDSCMTSVNRQRLRAVLTIRGETYRHLATRLDISESHLQRQIREAKFSQAQIIGLRGCFHPGQWRYITGQTDALEPEKAVV